MTRRSFLTIAVVALGSRHPFKQKDMMNNKLSQELWQNALEHIDAQFLMLTKLLKKHLPDLYIEQGNAPNRYCPLGAYIALANPKGRDIAQMDNDDMVIISVDFCFRGDCLAATANIANGIVLSSFPEKLIALHHQRTTIESEIIQTTAQISEFIQCNSASILQALG